MAKLKYKRLRTLAIPKLKRAKFSKLTLGKIGYKAGIKMKKLVIPHIPKI